MSTKRTVLVIAALLAALLITHARRSDANLAVHRDPGDAVLTVPKVFVAYWGWQEAGEANDPYAIKFVVNSMINTMFGSKYLSSVTQYYERDPNIKYIKNDPGAYLQYWDDADPLPRNANGTPKTITGADVVGVMAKVAQTFYTTSDTIIIVVTPWTWPVENTNDCSGHGFITSPAWRAQFWLKTMPIAPTQPNCGDSIPEAIATTLMHEVAESITNPWNNPNIGVNYGWYEPYSGSENADLCDSMAVQKSALLRRTQPAPYVPNTLFTVPLWSNSYYNGSGGCTYSYSRHDETFAIRGDGHLWWHSSLGGSNDDGGLWYDLGNGNFGALSGEPAVTSWGYGRYDVFMKSGGGDVVHAYTDNGGQTFAWANWGHPAGYQIMAEPAVSSWRPWQEDIFVFAATGPSAPWKLFWRNWDDYQDSGWQYVADLPVQALSDPSAIASAFDLWSTGLGRRRDLMYVGVDYHLWHAWTDDGATFSWYDWGTPPGKSLLGRPRLTSMWRNHFDIFVRNWSGGISHMWWQPGYGGWEDWPVPPVGMTTWPTATALGDGRLLIQVGGADGAVWRYVWDGVGLGWVQGSTTTWNFTGMDSTYW
jgi:hypothetical protein